MYSICDPEVLPQVQEAYPPQGQPNTFWILLAFSEIGKTWIIGGTKEILLCFTLPFFWHSDSRFAGVSVQDWQGIPERPRASVVTKLVGSKWVSHVFLPYFLQLQVAPAQLCGCTSLSTVLFASFCHSYEFPSLCTSEPLPHLFKQRQSTWAGFA